MRTLVRNCSIFWVGYSSCILSLSDPTLGRACLVALGLLVAERLVPAGAVTTTFHMPRLASFLCLLVLLMVAPLASAADDALIEVNAARAQRRLPPFKRDDGLTVAAMSCADYRAARFLKGHVMTGMGDFQFLPAGVGCRATGCAALSPDWGWQSCCSWERWQFAGAAVAYGRDGKRYMQLFVR